MFAATSRGSVDAGIWLPCLLWIGSQAPRVRDSALP